MDKSRLIHDFVDGTLNSVEEEQLFQMLASNDESRNELKQHLAIKSAVKNDTMAYTPTANSTMKVFSTLGFTAPIVGAEVNQGVSSSSATISSGTKAGFWSSFSSPIITGVVSTLATAVVAILLFQPFLNKLDNKINILQKENQQLTKQLENQQINNIPVVTSSSTDSKQTAQKTVLQKPLVKYIYIQRDNKTNEKSEINQKPIENEGFTNLDLSMSNIVNDKINTINNHKFNLPYDNKFIADIDFSNIYIRQNIGLNMEVNRLINWFDTAPTINPSNYNKMNNTSITLFYEVSDNISLGAEYRQETFFQTFRGIDNKGQLYEYQQQPNFTSGGLVARYSFNNLKFYGIVPYLQLYGGITNVGYIGRGMFGLKYSPYPNISFIVSGERSQLYYKFQNKRFNDGKFDLNYGVSFNF